MSIFDKFKLLKRRGPAAPRSTESHKFGGYGPDPQTYSGALDQMRQYGQIPYNQMATTSGRIRSGTASSGAQQANALGGQLGGAGAGGGLAQMAYPSYQEYLDITVSAPTATPLRDFMAVACFVPNVDYSTGQVLKVKQGYILRFKLRSTTNVVDPSLQDIADQLLDMSIAIDSVGFESHLQGFMGASTVQRGRRVIKYDAMDLQAALPRSPQVFMDSMTVPTTKEHDNEPPS